MASRLLVFEPELSAVGDPATLTTEQQRAIGQHGCGHRDHKVALAVARSHERTLGYFDSALVVDQPVTWSCWWTRFRRRLRSADFAASSRWPRRLGASCCNYGKTDYCKTASPSRIWSAASDSFRHFLLRTAETGGFFNAFSYGTDPAHYLIIGARSL